MKRYHSLVISQNIWDLVELYTNSDSLKNCHLETFNNCREQGLVLINFEKKLVIWTYTQRNTDLPTIIISTLDHMSTNNMYDDVAYRQAKSFTNTQLAALSISTYLEEHNV